MIPVKQTIFFDPDPKSPRGNCYQAVIASLLELNLCEVPHFYEDILPDFKTNTEEWNRIRINQEDRIDNWLELRNLRRIAFSWDKTKNYDVIKNVTPDDLVILSGMSPRGVRHAVIGRLTGVGAWEMVHDPHFSNTGIAEPDFVEKLTTITNSRKDKLLSLCQKFIADNKISCAETISQTDRVIESAYDFIENICDIVGYYQYGEDE
jgi:hypothetical protein